MSKDLAALTRARLLLHRPVQLDLDLQRLPEQGEALHELLRRWLFPLLLAHEELAVDQIQQAVRMLPQGGA